MPTMLKEHDHRSSANGQNYLNSSKGATECSNATNKEHILLARQLKRTIYRDILK